MNRNKTLTIAAAALGGLLAGSAARAAVVSTGQLASIAGQHAIGLDAPAPAPHDCKGQNSCKGQGGCKTGDKGCKGQNSCSGKGGCKVTAPTTKPAAL